VPGRSEAITLELMKTLKIVVNLTLAGLLIWFLVSHEQKIRSSVATRDSIQYWATGTLLLHHQNPYSVPDVQALESSQGYRAARPLMLRTPPWSVWMVLPLGMLNSFWAWVVWLAVLLASLVISMRISWRMYGEGPHAPAAFLLAGYLFAPVAACLVAGQMGMVLLLGIAIFLLLEEDRPSLAGAALLIPMAKPHIFALLWPIVAVWIIARRRWSLLGGIAAAFALANLIAVAFDHAIFEHYREMLQQQAIQHEFIPALSGMIRGIFFRRFFWVQFVPTGLGLLWSVRYYWKNRRIWNWRQHGPAVLVVSLLTTPYSWMTDEVVLLPAILQGAVWLNRAKLKVRSQIVILVFVFLDLLLLLIVRAQVAPATGIYFWSSLVWFSWYWYAKSFSQDPRGKAVATAP
jgi:Glycosyltransferase family 87